MLKYLTFNLMTDSMEKLKSVVKTISNNFAKICFKYLIQIICSIGLLYQVHLLFAEYLSGKTVVAVNVGRLENETLPAITLCLPHSLFLSIEKVSDINPELMKLYSEYVKQLENFNAERDNQAILDQNISEIIERIYKDVLDEMNPYLSSIPVYELLTNYSIPINKYKLFE